MSPQALLTMCVFVLTIRRRSSTLVGNLCILTTARALHISIPETCQRPQGPWAPNPPPPPHHQPSSPRLPTLKELALEPLHMAVIDS